MNSVAEDVLQVPPEEWTSLKVDFDAVVIDQFGKPSSPEHVSAICTVREREEEKAKLDKELLDGKIASILAGPIKADDEEEGRGQNTGRGGSSIQAGREL